MRTVFEMQKPFPEGKPDVNDHFLPFPHSISFKIGTSIFSFSHNVLYRIKDWFQVLSNI